MGLPLLMTEGVFYTDQERLIVQPDDGPVVDLWEHLQPFRGQLVDLSLHHFPPQPPDPSKPGGGSCFWGSNCPCGHQSDPAWLFNFSHRGVLSTRENGIWAVGQERIPFKPYMPGHRGRVVILGEVRVSPDKGVQVLLSEAEGLLDLLEKLRAEVKG